MFHIRMRLDGLEFNNQRWSQTKQRIIRRQIRNGARAFFRAAIAQVPKQTGMAIGTFINLKKVLVNVALDTSPTISGRHYYYHDGGKEIKDAAAGQRRSTPVTEIFSDDGRIFRFHYDNTVFHYTLNEFTPGFAPTAPWLSYEDGEKAFLQYMEEFFFKRLPGLTQFILVTTIIVGPEGISRANVRQMSPTEPEPGDE